MSDKIPCTKCGTMILPTTAARTSGVCMPCKQGIRESIEASKKCYEEQKKYDPHLELWKSLVHRVHQTDARFAGLTADEKLYYAVGILEGEAYNGGFVQFFDNSSGGLFRETVAGLEALGADRSLEILMQASKIAFQGTQPPPDWAERRKAMKQSEDESLASSLEILEDAFYEDPDELGEKLKAFANARGLITPFLR